MMCYRIVRCLVQAALLTCVTSLPVIAQTPTQPGAGGDARRGERLFQERCALCHAVKPDESGGGQGPSLAGVFGRRAASGSGFPYTKALRDSNLVWDAQTLDRFLTAPAQVVPGTAMPVNVPDTADRRDIIAYLATLIQASPAGAQAPEDATSSQGAAASAQNRDPSGDWRNDAPGVKHRIRPEELPPPFKTPSARNNPTVIDPLPNAELRVPAGFTVQRFATGLSGPRTVRVAPNGDLFVAETRAGSIRVLRAADGAATASVNTIYARGLDQPFGIAFYPQGPHPKWIYVANNNSVVRFAYRSGDLKARRRAQIVVPQLSETTGGHSTRDLVFSADGKRILVSVGSESNVAEDLPKKSPDEIQAWERAHGLGAAWDRETNRADVLVFDLDGSNGHTFAAGIRNCVGLTVNPTTGDPWCATNERDGLGDDLVPDYITRVNEGGFYGWPWYYIGSQEEPRHQGERPDLNGKATVPDVLLQAHSAALGITFYQPSTGPAAFPSEYRGDVFVTLHGSWNRSVRTGYKVVRALLKNGVPTGEYEDFLTGFVIDDGHVWGRPVGVAVAHDGALIVSEDGNGTLWRIAYSGAGTR
jgi:glucose/arabinose dehydrogenase